MLPPLLQRSMRDMSFVAWCCLVASTLMGCYLAGAAWPFAVGLALLELACVLLLVHWRQRHRDEEWTTFRERLERLSHNENSSRELGVTDGSDPLTHSNAQLCFSLIQRAFNRIEEDKVASDHARAGAEIRVRRLQIERDFLREVLTSVTDAVLIVDGYDELILANSAAESLLGLKRQDESYGKTAQAIANADIVAALVDTRRRQTTLTRSHNLKFNDSDGQERFFRLQTRAFAMSGGREKSNFASDKSLPMGVLAVLTDIGVQQSLLKRKAEYVSAVSHEMKTPLAGILAYTELLHDDCDDEATRHEFLNVISSQAERLQRMVENMLNLARIEAGVVKVEKKSRSLNEILQRSFHVLVPMAEQQEIRLNADLSPLYLGVFADADMLLQVAINLGSNAIKYTPAGGSVTLRSRVGENGVIFEWEDTGVGLSEEDRVKVFEKFYRVQKDSSMATGTGLGLPLVKHIVEDVHRGKIEVESKLGQGSTFRVVLPAVS